MTRFLWKQKRQGYMTRHGILLDGDGGYLKFRSDHLRWFFLTGITFGKNFVGLMKVVYAYDEKETTHEATY